MIVRIEDDESGKKRKGQLEDGQRNEGWERGKRRRCKRMQQMREGRKRVKGAERGRSVWGRVM